jgi:hypothetical protein
LGLSGESLPEDSQSFVSDASTEHGWVVLFCSAAKVDWQIFFFYLTHFKEISIHLAFMLHASF